MNKYVFIFHVDHKIEDPEFPARIHAWYDSLGDKLIDGGNPFNPDSEAHLSGGKVEHKADTAAGYSVVSAKDLEEATALAMACPMATEAGCSVNVYETMPM